MLESSLNDKSFVEQSSSEEVVVTLKNKDILENEKSEKEESSSDNDNDREKKKGESVNHIGDSIFNQTNSLHLRANLSGISSGKYLSTSKNSSNNQKIQKDLSDWSVSMSIDKPTTMKTKSGCSTKNDQEMIDITRPFLSAVEELELGQLLHDQSFGLFEAMSAIEMMDPKMDAGMICNKGKKVILNFDQAVDAGKLKLKDLNYSELIGIIDTTLCCLVTWLEGHSLAQTVFTNLYLHKPVEIIDKSLRAFSILTLKQVDVIEECVSKAGVFEEEDFQPSLYGYNLATQFTDSKTISMLRECEEDILKKVKNFKSQNINSNNSHIIQQTDEEQSELDYLNAFHARLKFSRCFYNLLLHLWKRENLNECPKLLTCSTESLSIIQKSTHLGVQRSNNESEEFMIGFELTVNQRLLPPTFPRSTRIRTAEESFAFLDVLLQRIKTVLKVTSLQNFHGIIEFFHLFSENQPCVLSRSLLQLLYGPMRFKKPGIEEMIEQMKESLKTFITPPVLMTKAITQNKEIAECVEMFFERCAHPFASLLMATGHNRARQRDKIAHLLIDDFANLQIETERIDAYIHQQCLKLDSVFQHGNCFGNWILYHISKIMIRYILIGFELELYSVHELSYIYWYLYEFLYGWLLSSLLRADSYMTEQESSAIEKLGRKGAKKSSKVNSNRKSKAYTKEICLLQAEQNLSGGYFKAMMGLMNDKLIPLPHIEFDNESVRYRHRFGAFNSIRTPAPVHYLQYKSIADLSSMQPSSSLYLASSRSFNQAKQNLEAISSPEKEVQDLLKIAKTNFIVVKLLASGHKVTPEFDFTTHMHFPILKIK